MERSIVLSPKRLQRLTGVAGVHLSSCFPYIQLRKYCATPEETRTFENSRLNYSPKFPIETTHFIIYFVVWIIKPRKKMFLDADGIFCENFENNTSFIRVRRKTTVFLTGCSAVPLRSREQEVHSLPWSKFYVN
ncbi:hypothetical protein TNCT_258371 [Trichonephila clavata]|uniref:Uncharacterized protein n=1 Tax=Trichonephila clavata TaxID=2740835 RepID=A0A8X6FAH7_TRICU|nr:hypothetical protein TNCT_258371 [Trichonephila clavata]